MITAAGFFGALFVFVMAETYQTILPRAVTTFVQTSASPSMIAYDSQRRVVYFQDDSCNVYRVLPNGTTALIVASYCHSAGYSKNLLLDVQNPSMLYSTDHSCVQAVDVDKRTSAVLVGRSTDGFSNGVGTDAQFYHPYGITQHPVTHDLIVADRDNKMLRGVVIATRTVTTITSWTFGTPYGMTYDDTGVFLFIASYDQHCIKVFDGNSITTFSGACGSSGSVDGGATAAKFSYPWGLAYYPPAKLLLVADSGSSTVRGVFANGHVITLTGGGAGFQDGFGTAARFSSPRSIAVDSRNMSSMYIADYSNKRLRFLLGGATISKTPTTTDDSSHTIQSMTHCETKSASSSAGPPSESTTLSPTHSDASESQLYTPTLSPSTEASATGNSPSYFASATRSSSLSQSFTGQLRSVSMSESNSATSRISTTASGPTQSHTKSKSLQGTLSDVSMSLSVSLSTQESLSASTTSTPTLLHSFTDITETTGSTTVTASNATMRLSDSCTTSGSRSATDTTSHTTTRSHTSTLSVLCVVEMCRVSSPPPSWDNTTAAGAIIAQSQDEEDVATLTALAVPYLAAISSAPVVFFLDCPGYPLPLRAHSVTASSGTTLTSSTFQHGSTTALALRLPNASSATWLPADALPYRNGNKIEVRMIIDCSGPQRIRLAIPVLPLPIPEIAKVAESVGSGLQWTSSVSGATTASSVGRVAASRRVLLCSIAAASSGGLLGLSIAHDADDDDGTTAFARGAIVGNTVVLLCAAACLGIAAVLYTHYTLSDSYRVGLVRMALPSSLLPVWTALVQGVAGAVPLVAASDVAADAGYAFFGVVFLVMPLAALTSVQWVVSQKLRLVCRARPDDDPRKAAEVRMPLCGLVVPGVVRRLLFRTSDWVHNDGSKIGGDERAVWAVLLEYQVVWYAAADAAVLLVVSTLSSLSGLGSASLCQAIAALTLTLYVLQLALCLWLSPFSTRLVNTYNCVCLSLSVINLVLQIVVVAGGPTIPSNRILYVTTSLELMTLGISLIKQAVTDGSLLIRSCGRVLRDASKVRRESIHRLAHPSTPPTVVVQEDTAADSMCCEMLELDDGDVLHDLLDVSAVQCDSIIVNTQLLHTHAFDVDRDDLISNDDESCGNPSSVNDISRRSLVDGLTFLTDSFGNSLVSESAAMC